MLLKFQLFFPWWGLVWFWLCFFLCLDTQLFISGHRTSVNLAKAQLAKIKVMVSASIWSAAPCWCRQTREIKHDVSSNRKIKLLSSVFSCLYNRVKIFVFAWCLNSPMTVWIFLLLTEFKVRTVSYGPSFFPLRFMFRARAINRRGKNEDP